MPVLYLDLRDALERAHEPLSLYLAGEVRPWTLEQLGEGVLPPLEAGQEVVLVCPLGEQSRLGAYYLHAEGWAASSLEGGIVRLRRQHERHLRLEGVTVDAPLERALLEHPRVRQFRVQPGGLELWGTVSDAEVRTLLERYTDA